MLVIVLLLYLNVVKSTDLQIKYFKELWDENSKIAENWVRSPYNKDFNNFKNTTTGYGTYDFIVVGGGSSGATLATRLAENPDFQVLLLEAGEDETDFSQMPAAFFPQLCAPRNWGYVTTPQKNACLGAINKQCDMSRGKILGGGSSVNAMLYVRGNSEDFDNWFALGNKGWAYKDVLPYFKKLENATEINGDANFRGKNGPLSITEAHPLPEAGQTVIQGNEELGYKNLDYNGKNQIGVNYMQWTIRHGRRDSTNQAYLKRIGSNFNNLHIFTKSYVTKLLISKDVVLGVQFIKDGQYGEAITRKEVIVSAGAINSPQLLMLSGIGSKSHLTQFDIKTIKHLPAVGQNLEDHPCVFNILINTNVSIQLQSFDKILEDYTKGHGKMSYAIGQEVVFLNTTSKAPEIEIITGSPNIFGNISYVLKQFNYNEDVKEEMNQIRPQTLLGQVVLLHPKSRGEITLKSSDPIDFPNINPRYLDNPYDIETLYEGIKHFQRLVQTEAFRKVNASIIKTKIKACENLKDKDYWYCLIRYKLNGLFHPVSTCKMGSNEVTSVVNNKLLVHGFKNLRVVDASIFPTSTSGHPNGAAIMIAEKIADEIKEIWNIFHGCLSDAASVIAEKIINELKTFWTNIC